MSYAKKNLRQIEDEALRHGFSEHQEARFPRTELPGDDGLEVLVFGPHVEGDAEMVPGFWGS